MKNLHSIFKRENRHYRLHSLFQFALTGLLFGGLTANSHALDLWDIYSLALSNDPVYQAEILSHSANVLELPIAETAFRTSVTANGRLGQERTDRSGTDRNNDDHSISIDVNLPIYNKANRVAINQSRHRVKISELSLREAKQDLILRVADRYFNVLAAQDAKEVARLEKISIRRQLDLASERLEVGLGTRTDLFDAKARLKQAEANEIQAQNNINNDIALLKQIIDISPGQLSPLSESAPLELPQPNNMESWINQALSNNVSLAIQSLELEIALNEIEREKSALLPVVSLDGRHRWADSNMASSVSGDSKTTNTTTVGITVSIPVYGRGLLNLRTRQTGLLYNQAERVLEQTRRSASTHATTTFLTMTSRVSRAEALFDAITAGESALEAKEEGFNAGLTTNLDVLDAQRDLSRSRTDYLRARYDYIISVLELERAVGDLDEEDLKRVNAWL